MNLSDASDLDATARILRRAADRGDADAQFMLAMCYRDGDGAAKSVIKAAYWFVAAADQGHVESAYAAAQCYRAGIDATPDTTKQDSVVYYQRDGAVTTKLAAAAFDYFALAAAAGHVESQFELGICFLEGLGVAADLGKAKLWLQRASNGGHMRAMMNLLFGGFVDDPAEKFRYCEIAALDGDRDGQYELGVCYRDGVGTESDLLASKLWFERASAQVIQNS